jgi:predicted nucleic acid-binding protein
MTHLDTNFLIQISLPGSSADTKFSGLVSAGDAVSVSSSAWAEFLCGPLDAKGEVLARQIFPQPEAFLAVDAALAAKLFNATGRRSRSLADCMIAAVAIRCGAKLATFNATDFEPFISHGLELV